MKDLAKIASESQAELSAIGIHTGEVTRYSVNSRAKRRLGLCTHIGNNKYEIEVSSLLFHEAVPEITLKYVVIHELIHTCKGCMNHGDKWKHYVEKVNRAYGYTISSNPYSHDRKDMDGVRTAKAEQAACEVKYKYICTGCGAEVNRYRASSFTKNPERYHCARCGGKFSRIF